VPTVFTKNGNQLLLVEAAFAARLAGFGRVGSIETPALSSRRGLPMGGHASPFTWELHERATQVRAPLVRPGPAFDLPVQDNGVPVENPLLGLKRMGARS
jgi:hypothetical protein